LVCIKQIKDIQPQFIDIDWENPIQFENTKWYLVSKIKGSNDILVMQHYIVFEDNLFQEWVSKK
jgi:hypothetical protein